MTNESPGFVPGEYEVQCEVCGEWLPEWDDPAIWHVYDDNHIAHDDCWRAQHPGTTVRESDDSFYTIPA